MESGLTRRAESYINPGDHRYSSHVAGVVEIRRTSEPGMEPYLPRVRRNCPSSVGQPLSLSYYGGGLLWSSNHSAIPANNAGVSTPWEPGCLVESKRQETHSKRLFVARLEGQSAWARIHRSIYISYTVAVRGVADLYP